MSVGVTVCGEGDRKLKRPSNIALDSEGGLYVADSGNHRVQYFKDPKDGSKGDTIAGQSESHTDSQFQLKGPMGLAIDRNGGVYIGWSKSHCIMRYTKDKHDDWEGVTVLGGKGLRLFGKGDTNETFNSPLGIAVSLKDHLYIADQGNHRIQFCKKGEDKLARFVGDVDGNDPLPGNGKKQLRTPTSICLDKNGDLYVADTGNHRIQCFPNDFTMGITIAGGMGPGDGMKQLNSPSGIAVDESGGIFVADTKNHRVQYFPKGNSFGATVIGGKRGSRPERLNSPCGLALNSEGLYVADQDNHRIQYFEKAKMKMTFSSGIEAPANDPVSTKEPVAQDLLDSLMGDEQADQEEQEVEGSDEVQKEEEVKEKPDEDEEEEIEDEPGDLILSVVALDGKKVAEFSACLYSGIADVQHCIAEHIGVPASHIILMLKGVVLDQESTLEDNGIIQNATLHLVLTQTRKYDSSYYTQQAIR